MLTIFDLDTSNKELAAQLLCDLTLLLVPQAAADIRKGSLPPLYSSGVKYSHQNKQACAFRMPSDVQSRGNGDCKQLVLWRMAELANAGEPTTARVMWLTEPDGLRAHILIRRADQSLEDPSVALGMPAVKDGPKQRIKRRGIIR
jgi:hypothetical protein